MDLWRRQPSQWQTATLQAFRGGVPLCHTPITEEESMRGSIRTRYKGSWNIIIDMGYRPNPETAKPKRIQKWFTVRGTKRDAEKKLAELLHQANRNELVEPTRLTLGTWLDASLETATKPPA